MTRKQAINRLTELGFENPVSQYNLIFDNLYANGFRIKDITGIDVQEYYADETPYTAQVHFGGWSVEI